MKYFGMLLMLGMIVSGCNPADEARQSDAKTPDQSTESSATAPEKMTGDNPETVASIEATAAKVEKDAEGFITQIDFRKQQIDPEALNKLPELTRLQSLLLNESNINDEGLKPVGQCTTLKNLDLRECSIGNKGMASITGLKNLKALRLSGQSGATTVDDEGMVSVGQLTGLKALLLDFLWVSGAGLAELKDLQGLEELYLASTLVGDEDLEQLVLFPQLKKLRVSKLSQVSRPGIEQIAQLSHLEDLDLSENSSLFDEDLAPISTMLPLRRLNLWRVAITDNGVSHLKDLTNLTWLNLDNTQLTDSGLAYLQKMQNLTFLHLGSTSISDAGLPKLEPLKSLKDLKVTRTAVTEAGVEKLKKELPDTEIQLNYLGDQ